MFKKRVAVPFIAVGPITKDDQAAQNLFETYSLKVVRGARRGGSGQAVTSTSGDAMFGKPLDYVGQKTLPAYAAYAEKFKYEIDLPGCSPSNGAKARLFAAGTDPGMNGSNGPIAGSFTAFVLDLVNDHTLDDAAPVDYATFELLPDPDGDSNNVDAYRSLF